MSEKQPFIHISAFKGAEFNINGETKSYSIMELFKFQDFLKGHLKTCAYLYKDLEYYKDYNETRVEVFLDEQKYLVEETDEAFGITDYDSDVKFEYSIGGNYAKFINVPDNHNAAKFLNLEFTKEFGEHTLEFDPESSYCYIYTTKREEAKQFLLFVYEKYIKSYLKEWYNGFDEFSKEFKNSKDEEKLLVHHLSW